MLSLAATIRIVEDWFGKDRPSRRSWKELLWTSPTASDFTMRESPTLRLFDDNKFFPSRYLPLSTLLPVVLLRRPRKFFLSLLSSPLFNILFSLHTKRWYNVIWLFWVVILVRNGAWWSCKKIGGAPFLFWNCYEHFESKLCNILIVSVCVAVGRKKGKGKLPLMPVDSGILRSTCVFRYTNRYHMFDSCNMGLFFFLPEWKIHGTITTPANEKIYMINSG